MHHFAIALFFIPIYNIEGEKSSAWLSLITRRCFLILRYHRLTKGNRVYRGQPMAFKGQITEKHYETIF